MYRCGFKYLYVRHKLKKGVKIHFLWFYSIFELTSDSLMTLYVERLQCPLHQFILLSLEPIPKIFGKKYWEFVELENEIFLAFGFWLVGFSKRNCFFFFPKSWKNHLKKLHTFGSWEFFLCSPDCPKQPRTSFPFYEFFYPIVSAKVSDILKVCAQ